MPRDLIELVGETPMASLATQTGKTIPEGLRDGFGLGLACELGQRLGELLGLGVSDVEGHACSCVDDQLHSNNTRRRCPPVVDPGPRPGIPAATEPGHCRLAVVEVLA